MEDSQNKSQYYPNINKSQLFADGYIAAKSGHSRGSAVDLTLLEIESGNELDMGSPWDFFDPISWVENNQITDQQLSYAYVLLPTTAGSGGGYKMRSVRISQGDFVYGVRGGGAGAPVALNVDGTATPVIWSGGTAPGHTDTYLIVSFALIDKIPASPAGNEEYVVFGSAGAFS